MPPPEDVAQIIGAARAVLAHQASFGACRLSVSSRALMGQVSAEVRSDNPPDVRRSRDGSTSPAVSPRTAAGAVVVSAGAAAGISRRVVSSQPARGLHARPTLSAVATALGDCTRCKLSRHRTSIVFGTGCVDAHLMFIGEGPGRDEDLQGEPFVGEAGKLLNRMIVAMGMARAEVYIANIVKCRPPKNRDPEPDEVSACEPFLRQQIAAVAPRVVVALGRFAAQTLLRDKTPIGRMRGHWRTYAQVRVMPTFHPAYLLRNPADKKLVWRDLQAVMVELAAPPQAGADAPAAPGPAVLEG